MVLFLLRYFFIYILFVFLSFFTFDFDLIFILKVFDVPPISGIGKPFEVRLPLALYIEYANTTIADSPFYGFEYDFSETRSLLLNDYKVLFCCFSDFPFTLLSLNN